MGVCGQRNAPAALLPGKTRYLLYRRLDGPPGRSRKIKKGVGRGREKRRRSRYERDKRQKQRGTKTALK
jgi:hypothetical protein